MQIMTAKFSGSKPLLMSNEQMANPLSKASQRLKEITQKRNKTEDDYWECARREFDGGMYFDDALGPIIPSRILRAALIAGAKKLKLGPKVTEGVTFVDLEYKLLYTGPRDKDGLWKKGFYDQRMVGNQRARVLRTRPMFKDWAVEFQIIFDPTMIDERNITDVLRRAETLGIGDYRPLFGTYQSKVLGVAQWQIDLPEAAE